MKKILFLITLLTFMGGANSVKAGKRYLTFSCPDYCNATWNSETNTFTWGAFDGKTAEWVFMTAEDLSGDLSSWTKLHLRVSSFTNASAQQLNVVFKTNNGSWPPSGPTKEFTVSPDGKGNIDIDLTSVDWGDCDISNIQDLTIYGCDRDDDSKHGSVVVTDCYLYKPTTISFNSSGVATIPVTEIVATGGFSISAAGVVTCDGTEGTLVINFDPSVDLTSLKRYDVEGPGQDKIIWRSIMDSQSTNVLAYYGSRWGGNLTGAERAKATAVNVFKWESKSNSELADVAVGDRTFTINSITLTADAMSVVNAHDVPVASLPHYIVAADGSVSVGAAIATNYGVAADQSLGDGSSKMDEYLDIEDYDELRVYTSDTNDRLFFINETITTGTNARDGATLKLSGEGTIFSHNTTEGYYYTSVAAIKSECGGQAKLIGAKGASWGVNSNISKIQVLKENPTYDYVLSGQYSLATVISDVTSDASVTAIDCSNLSGNNISITSSNPNCMFKARAGVLANNKNVIVGSKCANLVLTDGNPFKAPVDFTATETSYTGRSFTADKTTTVCLPFALTSTEAATLGTFYELDSFGEGTLNFVSVESPSANTPYLVVPTSTSLTLSEANKAIAATPADVATSITNVDFIGTLAATAIPASDAEYSYYAYNNGDFVKIETKAATLPAFRGYFKVATTAISGARLAARFVGGSVTGINEVSEAQGFNNFEGKVFENGKIVIFKKGMKFNANGARLK